MSYHITKFSIISLLMTKRDVFTSKTLNNMGAVLFRANKCGLGSTANGVATRQSKRYTNQSR